MPKESKQESFEQLYARLEESVARLEAGGLSLEEAITLYEEGMAQAKRCQDRLDEAEQRITKLKESFASLPRRDNGAQAARKRTTSTFPSQSFRSKRTPSSRLPRQLAPASVGCGAEGTLVSNRLVLDRTR